MGSKWTLTFSIFVSEACTVQVIQDSIPHLYGIPLLIVNRMFSSLQQRCLYRRSLA